MLKEDVYVKAQQMVDMKPRKNRQELYGKVFTFLRVFCKLIIHRAVCTKTSGKYFPIQTSHLVNISSYYWPASNFRDDNENIYLKTIISITLINNNSLLHKQHHYNNIYYKNSTMQTAIVVYSNTFEG